MLTKAIRNTSSSQIGIDIYNCVHFILKKHTTILSMSQLLALGGDIKSHTLASAGRIGGGKTPNEDGWGEPQIFINTNIHPFKYL